jgi:uncharacterized protein with FMN-binding domain
MRTSTIKSIAALALTGAGSALVLGFRTSGDGAPATTNGSSASDGSGSAGSTTTNGSSTGSSSSGSGSGPGSASAAPYADGTYKGTEVSEPWGPFQVQVTISNGSITKVSVVESPSDRRSSNINSQAVPMLTQATLASQGTSVDMVSGATWTSDSYATSLQSALDQAAKAA